MIKRPVISHGVYHMVYSGQGRKPDTRKLVYANLFAIRHQQALNSTAASAAGAEPSVPAGAAISAATSAAESTAACFGGKRRYHAQSLRSI